MGLFSRLVRMPARIPTSELGPAAGPFPTSLMLPRYLDETDEEEPRERPERAARQAPVNRPAGGPLFRPGNVLGDLVGGILDAIVNLAVARTVGPTGAQIIRRIPAAPGQPAPTSRAVDQELEIDERTPLAEAVQRRDPYAVETARRRAESAARMVGVQADIERLGASSVGADMELDDGREVIAIDRIQIGPEEEAI